jgi:hypothetical protein
VAFCLAAVLVLLGGLALISLGPWGTTSVGPNVSVAPGAGAALEDATVAAPARPGVRAGLAAATVANRGGPGSVAVGAAAPRSAPASALGISAARPVQSPAAGSPPVQSPQPQAPGSQPVSPPTAAPAKSSSAPQPTTEPSIAAAGSEEEPLAASPAAPRRAGPTTSSGPSTGPVPIAVRLTGNQDSSEPILAGEGDGEAVQIHEGHEYALAFSFYIQTMVYGEPGAPNLIMRMVGDADPAPSFGLQLWDYPGADGSSGGRGLWSAGDAMGGDRFLAPAAEGTWHDVVVLFSASSEGAGYYALYLDGQPVEVRVGVSTIPPGSSYAQVEIGLFRDGELLPGTSQIWVDAVTLGETLGPLALP